MRVDAVGVLRNGLHASIFARLVNVFAPGVFAQSDCGKAEGETYPLELPASSLGREKAGRIVFGQKTLEGCRTLELLFARPYPETASAGGFECTVRLSTAAGEAASPASGLWAASVRQERVRFDKESGSPIDETCTERLRRSKEKSTSRSVPKSTRVL